MSRRQAGGFIGKSKLKKLKRKVSKVVNKKNLKKVIKIAKVAQKIAGTGQLGNRVQKIAGSNALNKALMVGSQLGKGPFRGKQYRRGKSQRGGFVGLAGPLMKMLF